MKMPIEPIGTGVIPTLNPSEHTLYPPPKKVRNTFWGEMNEKMNG